jgi:hypothetical protein
MHSVFAQVSEGLDFADRAGRAVIVTGMPFATPTDPKVCFYRYLLIVFGTGNYVPKYSILLALYVELGSCVAIHTHILHCF